MSADNPTFLPESATEIPEERLTRTISEIRESYQGVLYGSSQSDALINLRAWLGLDLQHGPKHIATRLMDGIMARRKQDPDYRKAMNKLDTLANGCLTGITGDDELWAATTGLNDKLDTLIDELYPEHAQPIARVVPASK